MTTERSATLDAVLETVQGLFHDLEDAQDSVTLAEGRHLATTAREIQAWLFSVRSLLSTDEEHQVGEVPT